MSSDTTAHTLAPSEEAFDAPLSPPPLDDKPGPATERAGTLTRMGLSPTGLTQLSGRTTPGNLTASREMPGRHVQHLASHLGDEIETARNDDEIIVGGAFASVRERDTRTRVLIRRRAESL